MVLQLTAAYSSRVTKANNPLSRRSSSSPFSNHLRRKPTTQKSKVPTSKATDNETQEDRLEDLGLIRAPATDLRLRDVAQYLQYIADKMFDDIPDRAGMGSTRIAEVLNYRKSLPPIISTAHVHALSQSPTATEREIAELIHGGIIRKISIPGRGIGAASIGESLVLVDLWVEMVLNSEGLCQEVKDKYITTLRNSATAVSVPAGHFLPHEVVELAKYGYLTTTSIAMHHPTMLRSESSIGTLASLSSVGSRNAAGSAAAVGGQEAIHDAGGGGLGGGMHSGNSPVTEYRFSLPSVGIYLRLLEAARTQLISLLSTSKYKEAPRDLLRERWDGGVGSGAPMRGTVLTGGLLPAKTRKWKQFYGLRFDWVLEECLGTGLVEIFNTGSVGHGVRLT